MERRLLLHQLLSSIPGVSKAWFQEPSADKLTYPCIIYKVKDDDVQRANNGPYTRTIRYDVTVIDLDPDSVIPDLVANIPMCRLDRTFVNDNLNHSVFNLYF